MHDETAFIWEFDMWIYQISERVRMRIELDRYHHRIFGFGLRDNIAAWYHNPCALSA